MADRVKWSLPLVFSLMCVMVCVRGNVRSKVRCSERWMEVDIARSSPDVKIYLQQLKDYPEEACKAHMTDSLASFRLSLLEEDMLRCGITRVVNKLTGQKVYYHRIIVEEPSESRKRTFTVKCLITEVLLRPEFAVLGSENENEQEEENEADNRTMGSEENLASDPHRNESTIRRRSVLPVGFQEPDVIDIGGEISGSAPVPILGIGVRQGGNLITGELNVSPGTPLQMEIFLDTDSAPIYGLLLTYMQVTDTKFQEETIIINGCSVDPYLFENFNTVDGDFLTAKFRAFKFPESNYVQFRGTVNVCLDKCQGIECSNGQIGFGRKRRAIATSSADRNKVFEVTMSTFIRVDFEKDTPMDDALSELYVRRGTRIRAKTRAVMAETLEERHSNRTKATSTAAVATASPLEERAFIAEKAKDQFKYKLDQAELPRLVGQPSSTAHRLSPYATSFMAAAVSSFLANLLLAEHGHSFL